MNYVDQILIEKAKKRDREEYKIQEKETNSWRNKCIISILPYIVCMTQNIYGALFPAFLLALFTGLEYQNNHVKLNELKKYREYLSMYKELEKESNKDITKIIEKDEYYREPLNIRTVENFTYNDIKLIKKELKRRSNNINAK